MTSVRYRAACVLYANALIRIPYEKNRKLNEVVPFGYVFSLIAYEVQVASMGSDGADRRPRPARLRFAYRLQYVESKLTSLKRYRRTRATPGEVPGMCDVPAVSPDERESRR